jgi:peptide/nickel transport system ATP-binding protein
VADPVLGVRDLRVRIGRREIVRGISFDVARDQTLGIVGESGSGKSMTVLAATGLLDAPGAVISGTSTLAGAADSAPAQLVGASARLLREVHGGRIGFVFQDPGTSLNPLLTVERQITESLEAHRNMTRQQARGRALELLEAVGLPQPQTRLNSYPHQLSGGQRQRVMIAIALLAKPRLLLADEPTTALDVLVQKEVLDLLFGLQKSFGMAMLFISHNLALVAQRTARLAVLSKGMLVESGSTAEIVRSPSHPYVKQLLAAVPRLETRQ